jgi:uncharacterized protein
MAVDPITPPAPLPAGKRRGAVEQIFLTDNGLRAGWRFLIYLALFLAADVAGESMVRLLFGTSPTDFSYGWQLTHECIAFGSALGVAAVMSHIEKRPLGAYGLPAGSAFGKMFWVGWLFGFCEVSALVGLIAAFGGYCFGSLALEGVDILRWAILWSVLFLMVGFFEEFLFRGYTQFTLAEGGGFWPAAVFLSVLFGGVHITNQGENWVGAAGVVVIGLVWCLALRRTGSLWFAVGMHASFDFGETFLYSVPDSGLKASAHLSNAVIQGPRWLTGGSVGPEASLFSFLTMAMVAVTIHFLFPARKPGPQ